MDVYILIKFIINILSVILHICLLLLICCRPGLKSRSFDELFFSQNVGDIVAVFLRVVTKYAPLLVLHNHSGIIHFDKTSFPLATITNASEWYSNYVIICSAFFFGCDRAVMAVSFDSYTWFCNRVFKWCVVVLTWMLPLLWCLPMLDPCCRSQYYGGRIELLEMQRPQADLAYDAIDMVFETLFYVPVICFLNGFTLIMLYSKWNDLVGKIHDQTRNEEMWRRIPSISEVCALCRDGEAGLATPSQPDNHRHQKKLLERLELELSFSIISIIDQQMDFFAVLFYSLYWAGYSDFIAIDITRVLEIYYHFFELGTLITPYILLAFCGKLRAEFVRFVRCRCMMHQCVYEEEEEENEIGEA